MFFLIVCFMLMVLFLLALLCCGSRSGRRLWMHSILLAVCVVTSCAAPTNETEQLARDRRLLAVEQFLVDGGAYAASRAGANPALIQAARTAIYTARSGESVEVAAVLATFDTAITALMEEIDTDPKLHEQQRADWRFAASAVRILLLSALE